MIPSVDLADLLLIHAHYMRDVSYTSLASLLGVGRATIVRRLNRGKKALRQKGALPELTPKQMEELRARLLAEKGENFKREFNQLAHKDFT